MVIEWSLGLMAAAAVGLAAAGVPALLALRRTARETEHLAALLREELPPLLRELRATTQHVDQLTDQVDEGLHRLRQASGFVRQAGPVSWGGSFLWRTLLMGAGLRAAAAAVQRWRRRGVPQPEEVRNGQ